MTKAVKFITNNPQARIFAAAAVVSVLTGLNAAIAHAQSVSKEPRGPVVACGESEYQLVYAKQGGRGIRWKQAEQAARQMHYAGQRGRLAIIEDMETHNCVRTNLMSSVDNEVWIGLRYWCRYQKLQWATGDIRPPGKPSPWALRWSLYDKCGTQYMGVYYTDDTKRWQAVESSKRWAWFLVEYPAVEKER